MGKVCFRVSKTRKRLRKLPIEIKATGFELCLKRMNFDEIFENLDRKGIETKPETLEKIKELLRSKEDAFEDPYEVYADPIVYINSRFPDEESLVKIDFEIEKVESEIKKIDADLADQLETICGSQDISVDKINDTISNLCNLVNKIEVLNTQAKENGDTVVEITKDIRKLENAKKNISSCISILHHFQLFSDGICDLRDCLEKVDFKRLYQVLQSLVAFREIFIDLEDVPQITELLDQFENIKGEIKSVIMLKFEESCYSEDHQTDVNHQSMSYITLMADKIFDLRNQFIGLFVNKLIDEYMADFVNNEGNSRIEHIELRYSWLKGRLAVYDELYNLWFPYSWEVDYKLSETFCIVTSKNLDEIITSGISEIDPRLFLVSLQRSINFEDYLVERYSFSDSSMKIEGILTSVFLKHIQIYIQFQDRNLNTLLSTHIKLARKEGLMGLVEATQQNAADNDEKIMKMAEGANAEEKFHPVLSVASELFLFYKKCLIQFTKMKCLSHIEELIHVFKKYLIEFMTEILESPMNRSVTKIAFEKYIPLDRVKQYCSVLATSSYCHDTVDQLEIKLSELVSNNTSPEFSFSSIQNKLSDISAQAINILANLIDQSLEPAFSVFSKTSWSTYQNVGDQSLYVTIICQILTLNIPRIRDCLDIRDTGYEKLMVQFSNVFMSKYFEKIFSCKNITAAGIEQIMLKVHKLILELVITPHKPFEEFVEKYKSYVEEPTLENFKRIVGMKSLKKNEETLLVEGFSIIDHKS
ncbi:Vacuolar protein sorting-associated protein 53 [Thelohanellus kitauei]|uniref:Vacuolar protein sorting-associated protein 53 n=1 Tax=Thelohanellus kitauei TaxID=669202 RepID=A0A0C2MVF1_THEKT|nr:Vacuolar protein sorting-associated protein 53 [Thelohanellus kitauei]